MLVLILPNDTLSFNINFGEKKPKSKKEETYVMTEVELQSYLMSYADRFASILTQSFEDFDDQGPTLKARRFVLGDVVYSLSSVFTIAADPNPQVALLDMIVVTTLGRIIYEDNILRMHGETIEIMIEGFRELETDIWQISLKVLTNEQQQELRELILQWRKQNPSKVIYNYIRFSDFAAERRKSTLVKKGKTDGVFKSVKQATEQVEEMRMLAERGIFLGTRLPLLTGTFAEAWMSQLIVNPEFKKILDDFHSFSLVSQRMTNVAEQMPNQIMKELSKLRWHTVNQVMQEVTKWSDVTLDKVMEKVAIEREAFISQFMDRLFGERESMLQGLVAEEQRITALVTGLRETISEGNNLLLTVNTLIENFKLGKPSAESQDSKPFDIKDYRDTVVEVTKLVESTNRLATKVSLEELLPQLVKTIDSVESKGENLIDHTFKQIFLLILILLIGYIVARLTYVYLSKKLIKS